MKKIISVTIILLLMIAASAQSSLTSFHTGGKINIILNSKYRAVRDGLMNADLSSESRYAPYIDYLKRSKSQTITGCILTGAGIVAIAIALGHDLNNLLTDESSPTGLYLGGLAAIGTGIVLFIAAGKNKRKAIASMSFKRDEMKRMLASRGQSYPAIGLKITF